VGRLAFGVGRWALGPHPRPLSPRQLADSHPTLPLSLVPRFQGEGRGEPEWRGARGVKCQVSSEWVFPLTPNLSPGKRREGSAVPSFPNPFLP